MQSSKHPCALLISQLHELFEVEKLIFIPQDPEDFTGHADGMVRFLNDKAVLVNAYAPDYRPLFQKDFYASLSNAGLECITIPYSPDANLKDSAKGVYINYLEVNNIIIVPTFGIPDNSNQWSLKDDCANDDCAIILLESVFKDRLIKQINCNELAPHGGLLNCISWNICK